MKRKRRYRRGYPVAILVGLEDNHAIFWNVFSKVVKQSKRLEVNGQRTDEKSLYNLHESIIDELKPSIRKGVRSIVLVSPARTNYGQQFLEHIKKHHMYLIQSRNPNSANFGELVGSAEDNIQVSELVKTNEFLDLIEQTTTEEADQVVNNLEKHLYGTNNNSTMLYSLKEIEDYVYRRKKTNIFQTKYLLLTNKYLAQSHQKSRIHRLMQIAQNKKIQTKVINAETSAGSRITQFGGIVFFTKK